MAENGYIKRTIFENARKITLDAQIKKENEEHERQRKAQEKQSKTSSPKQPKMSGYKAPKINMPKFPTK